MTERQLVLVRLFGVSLWLLRTRLVDTVATWVMRVIMCFIQYTPRRFRHVVSVTSAIVAQFG